MFTRLGSFTYRRRRAVLGCSVFFLVIAGFLGGGVFDRLQGGGFEDPSAEAVQARDLLQDRFDTGPASVVFLLTADDGSVDSADSMAAGQAFTVALANRGDLDDVASYWSLGSAPPLRSAAGDKALVLARIPGNEDSNPNWQSIVESLEEEVGSHDGFSIELGGLAETFERVGTTIEGDLARAESVAVPITLVLLVGVFGGIVAALLPMAVGILAIIGAFLVLYLITGATDVSVFSINLVTALGLGLAIDYSLFVVNRFREELAHGVSVEQATIRTVETAGRTVAFSALTVAVSLSALLIFPLYFLRSFAFAGIGVLLVAMTASVVALPALLGVLGPRVDKWQVFGRKRVTKPVGEGFWHRIATAVMKRPVSVAIVATALLVGLGLPFFSVEWGLPDDRVLPADDPARIVAETIRSEFDTNEANAMQLVIVDQPGGEAAPNAASVDQVAGALSLLGNVTRVDASTGRYAGGQLVAPPDPSLEVMTVADAAWFNIVPGVDAISLDAEQLVGDIRALELPFDESALGGQSAGFVDSKDAIFSRVPIAAAIIGVATFVLLFLMFGSILVPIKAIVLNLLSLTATFGAMVWVFQMGNGADLLGFTPTGLTDITTPILMFCIAFGLSMDYEVFLLSRIKEEYDRTGDNDAAVAAGLERTGRIVTAAAVLLAVTFLAFATSGVTFIKLFGLGLAMAVLVDATIVRATLVPALMTMAGNANWWAPAWMTNIYERFGISEGGSGIQDDRESEQSATSAELVELRDRLVFELKELEDAVS